MKTNENFLEVLENKTRLFVFPLPLQKQKGKKTKWPDGFSFSVSKAVIAFPSSDERDKKTLPYHPRTDIQGAEKVPDLI